MCFNHTKLIYNIVTVLINKYLSIKMRIKKYYEFKEELIKEADEDEFGLDDDTPEEGDDKTDEDTTEEGDEFSEGEEKPYNDNPETYIKNALKKLKNKLDSLFNDEEEDNIIENPESSENGIGPEFTDRSKRDKKDSKENMTLKDMGYKLESSDILKGSKTHKTLVIKFSDDTYYYSVYIKVSLKEAIKLIDDGEELTDDSVQKAYIKLKKIKIDGFEEIGTVNRNVMLADIDEDFIIELKLELDEDFSDEDEEKEEFSIET